METGDAAGDTKFVVCRHFAHARTGLARSEWHSLEEHLRDTAALASSFADRWGAGEIGFLAGLWHDLGKYAPDWQTFLDEAGEEAPVLGEEQPVGTPSRRRRGPDHSTAGAIHAQECLGRGPLGLALQFTVAGHHAGLADRAKLDDRLTDAGKRARYQASLDEAPVEVRDPGGAPMLPPFLTAPAPSEVARRRFEGFVRMLFSALIDADHLDTERFFQGAEGVPHRRHRWRNVAEYVGPLERHLDKLQAQSERSGVNDARRRVLGWCRETAEGSRGAYTLTVPTGGGKTLASLAFALLHARHHRLDRVIVALPFLSIVDQTVDVFRGIFEPELGAPALVEHHSSIRPEHDTMANRLATENWDAPLIVTTQVQLLESLFGARPRDCRKLHNLANSVIVLDEVQTLPVGLLAPILDQLQALTAHYGVSLLLTTATQPALHSRPLGTGVFPGLDPVPREIVPANVSDDLFETFRRVRVRWPESEEPVGWDELADRLVQHPQALAIVHRRDDAAQLWRALEAGAPGASIHLSALMCAAHRREALGRVGRLLKEGRPCRVVATQVVEAGVDLDFPVVYRAFGGLESLAQAAGRCNREGRLAAGDFFVFLAPTEPPASLAHHRDIARIMLAADPSLDLTHPATFRAYFDRLYGNRSTDVHQIQRLRKDLGFASVARQFRMIEDAGTPVFVPYGERGRSVVEELRAQGPSRERFRALQPFAVTVYPNDLRAMVREGRVEVVHETVHVLVAETDYHPDLGLRVDPEPFGMIVA